MANGNRFENAFQSSEENIKEFDPREAATTAARAQFGAFEEDLREDMERLRGRQVGAGRLQSGFGWQDQDRFIRDRLDRLNRTLAQNAIDVAGMRQEQLRARQRRSDKQGAGLGGTIGSLVGGAGGFLVGGPQGAMIGSQIGGGVGKGAASLF